MATAVSRKFYVNADTGSDLSPGTTQSRSLATITAALALCVSGRGDTIYVMPGSYEENVIVTKDYVNIVGLFPGGYARPDIVPTSGIPMIVRAQGVTLEHLRMGATAADALKVEGNGFHIHDCVMDGDGTANKAGLLLVPNATDDSLTASEGLVEDNYIRGNAYGIIFDTAAAPVGVGSTHNRIRGNTFVDNTIDIGTKDSGTGTYSVQFAQIGPENSFLDKNKTTYIDLTTANGGAASDQTGIIVGNYFNVDAFDTTVVKMVGTGFGFTGNRSNLGLADGTGLD